MSSAPLGHVGWHSTYTEAVANVAGTHDLLQKIWAAIWQSLQGKKPYTGSCRQLIVGIDIGTTFSGVSYCILDPGVVPVIQGVNRYPAQERVGGDAKIPTIIYYDRDGSVRAVGAEALLESNIEQAKDQQWVKAEWFKLALRPNATRSPRDHNLPPLPLNKTIEHVFGDFLRYIYQCTRQYIEETHASGSELWPSLEDSVDFVFTHPNGWEGRQQAQMQRAAIYAGLVPDTHDGYSRVKFVTEGEASLHYCISNNFASDIIKSGQGVMIVDAGGGTIDVNAYHMKTAPGPIAFEEIAPAMCQFQGSVYVSRRAKVFLREKLHQSRYGTPDDIDYITERFDKSTKLSFKDPNQFSYIKFGTSRDTDPSVGVKYGQVKLQGSQVAAFFEPSIVALQEAIQQQMSTAHAPITSVLLVGGFAASTWLFSNLRDHLRAKGLRLCRPDGHLGKAVADGAVSFLVDHFVSVRVARTTFGIQWAIPFDKRDPEHRLRSDQVIEDPDGELYVSDCFQVLLPKGTRVLETAVFRKFMSAYFLARSKSQRGDLEIWGYKGNNRNPQWMDLEPDKYFLAGRVVVDLRSVLNTFPILEDVQGTEYHHFPHTIELSFGSPETKAQICWEENGEEKRSPATIVYDKEVGKP